MGLTLVIGNKRYSSWSLRGWLAARLTGEPVAEEMIWLDRPGLGWSERPAGPWSPGREAELIEHFLTAIGVPRAQVHVIGDRGAVCEELVVCSLWSHGPKTHRHEVFAELTRFTAAMRGAAPRRRWWQRRRDRDYPERVFLAREDASNRFLTNAAALEARLVADGFVKFNTGKLPLIEQIELFDAAREVVAIAGASLTNMLFCQPGYRLTMLAPRSMPAIFFWDLAHHTEAGFLAAHYGVADNPKAGIKSDFSVDLDSVWAPS